MVELTQEEFESLKAKAEGYDALQAKYNEEVENHGKTKEQLGNLKDDYIAICKGQRSGEGNNTDDFDAICKEKYGK